MDIVNAARRSGTPVIGDEQAVFLWIGDRSPQVRGDFNGWQGQEMEPLEDGVWALNIC
jgi:1,4-alpha-glucan branching enzyme